MTTYTVITKKWQERKIIQKRSGFATLQKAYDWAKTHHSKGAFSVQAVAILGEKAEQRFSPRLLLDGHWYEQPIPDEIAARLDARKSIKTDRHGIYTEL